MNPVTKRLADAFVATHQVVYERTGGRIGHSIGGRTMLVLYTTGRKTGRRRSSVLLYVRDGDHFGVIGSNNGGPKHPAWYHNLLANPEVEAQIGNEHLALRARVAEGEERQRLWDLADASNGGGYTKYAKRTDREIPVVVLERR